MTDGTTAPTPPIVCDMSGAPDTLPERLAEYGRLFDQALVGRERTDDGIRFRFRAEPGVEAWVRGLARREKACCAFFDFAVTVHDDEVCWEASVVDDNIARQMLDELYILPDALTDAETDVVDRLTHPGLRVMTAADDPCQ